MRYGELPRVLTGTYPVAVHEMMFYQDMLAKDSGSMEPLFEERLNVFNTIISAICRDFISEYGLNAFRDAYMYISAKNIFQRAGAPFNRPGWHADGFMSNDVNYIWYDKCPTIFNISDFQLTQDHLISINEMDEQAYPENQVMFPVHSILRLNQFNIHRVADDFPDGMRAFLKVSFSGDRFDLSGNSYNYLIRPDWPMRPRTPIRNVPQNK